MFVRAVLIIVTTCTGLPALTSCAAEVGSPRWCESMRDKPRGDWTANEALEFARHCLFETEE